jgi:Ca2+-binding RTX toxin-like protein
VGRRASDVIYGDSGNDRILGGASGHDRICGGPGDDRIEGGKGNDLLYGGSGDDRLEGGRGSDKAIAGGPGRDRLSGGRGNDFADGGPGADSVDGGLGDDRVSGGSSGRDRVVGGHGSDRASGGTGNRDVVRGDLGRDRLDGGRGGRDIVSYASASGAVTVDLPRGVAKGDGRDLLRRFEQVVDSPFSGLPSEGPAVVRGRAIDGTTTLAVNGGPGGEYMAISADRSGYVVTGESGSLPIAVEGCTPDGASGAVRCPGEVDIITVSSGGGDDIVRIAQNLPPRVRVRLDGGEGADTLYGGSGDEVIEGGDDGDPDLLIGRAGDDALVGARTDLHVPVGSGRSTMIGGSGSDVMVGGDPCDGDVYDGGPGEDNANFFRFTPGVTARIGGPAWRTGEACTPGHVGGSVEAMEGTPGPDRLVGDGRRNTLNGGGSNDVLRGLGGPDRLVGGAGGDRLLGGSGRDSAHQ